MRVNPVLVAGAGPAGLTAALELSRAGVPVVVHEADSLVGGIARTETYRGYRFDIGGHRFYTRSTRWSGSGWSCSATSFGIYRRRPGRTSRS